MNQRIWQWDDPEVFLPEARLSEGPKRTAHEHGDAPAGELSHVPEALMRAERRVSS